ncbi:retrotransposon protein, putative, ty1-copia subclass [Tanacetum coccineum]
MLQELNSMFEKQAGVKRFDLIPTFNACKLDDGKPVGAYVLKMKDYVEKLERLGYVLPQDLSVGLILNGLTSDFANFVRNYNMHNMGKTIGELHALLIEYDKCLPKKAATPQVMAIQGGKGKGKDKSYIPKPKNPKPSAKEHPTKNDACHHCKEVGHWKRNCPVYLAELMKNKKQVGTASSLVMHYRLAHISKKRIKKLQQDGLLKLMDDESFDQCVSCLSGKMTRKSFSHRPQRATDLLGLIHTDVCGPLRHVSIQYASYFITFTDDYSRYGYIYLLKHKHEVLETFKVFKNEVENQLEKIIKAFRSDRGGEYISQEFKDYLKACGIIQQLTPPYTPQHNGVSERRNRTLLDMVWGCEALVKRDTLDKLQQRSVKCIFIGYPKETMGYYFYFPPENKIVVASEIPIEVEGFEPPHKEEAPVRRSARTHRAPERLCLNVKVEEHNNQVWRLVDLPPDCKIVRSKWIFKKKTEIDGNVYTYKARLVAKGFTQVYEVDYEETFSPIADIRAIRILIAIAAFYDYEIWQMDVEIAFLNGYLDEDIYMVHPEGEATFILRIKIYRDKLKRLIGLSQSAYMDKILMRYRMDNSKRGHIPMFHNVCDLRNTKDMFLVYGGNPEAELRVDCYCDARFETDRDDIKSQT